MNQIEAVQNYLANSNNHLIHMQDGDYSVKLHDPKVDAHLVNRLDDVTQDHINPNPYNIVTVKKDFLTSDHNTLTKVVKLQVDAQNNISNVVESK